VNLKYAHVERERRWVLSGVPAGLVVESTLRIADRYLTGTRLRLREVVADDGGVVRKLGQKVRLGSGAEEVAHTSLYLDEAEWAVLSVLAGTALRKERRKVRLGGVMVALDVFAGHCAGLVLAEVDRGDGEDRGLPAGLPVVSEVTGDEFFTGGALAAADRAEVEAALSRHGVAQAWLLHGEKHVPEV
jgi:CYTH domain-containing protein